MAVGGEGVKASVHVRERCENWVIKLFVSKELQVNEGPRSALPLPMSAHVEMVFPDISSNRWSAKYQFLVDMVTFTIYSPIHV